MFRNIALASIPVISFILQYHFSRKDGKFESFKAEPTVFYADWFLIPFNFVLPFTFLVKPNVFVLIIILTIIGTFYFHKFWGSNVKNNNSYIFEKSGKLSTSGKVHFIFTILQAPLVIGFLISPIKNLYTFLAIEFLFMYLVGYSFGLKAGLKRSSKVPKPDLYLGIALVVALITKLFV